MINQQPCSSMIPHVVKEWWNNKIERLRCNNHELGCCIKSGFVCSNIGEQPLSIRQAVYNMLKHDWTILLFYQSCSIMLTMLLLGCWANNPVIACDMCLRVYIQNLRHLSLPNINFQIVLPILQQSLSEVNFPNNSYDLIYTSQLQCATFIGDKATVVSTVLCCTKLPDWFYEGFSLVLWRFFIGFVKVFHKFYEGFSLVLWRFFISFMKVFH